MARNRLLKLAVAGLLTLWLGAVTPAHRLLDLHHAEAEAHAQVGGDCHDHDAPVTPHQHDDGRCAVCLFARGLTLPAPVTLVISAPQLAATLTERAPPAPVIATLPTPIRGRAPPAC